MLQPGQSTSYLDTYDVTRRQLDAGRIVYSLRYSFVDAAGADILVARPIAAMLKDTRPQQPSPLLVEQ